MPRKHFKEKRNKKTKNSELVITNPDTTTEKQTPVKNIKPKYVRPTSHRR